MNNNNLMMSCEAFLSKIPVESLKENAPVIIIGCSLIACFHSLASMAIDKGYRVHLTCSDVTLDLDPNVSQDE